jgi:hypothetical protein
MSATCRLAMSVSPPRSCSSDSDKRPVKPFSTA